MDSTAAAAAAAAAAATAGVFDELDKEVDLDMLELHSGRTAAVMAAVTPGATPWLCEDSEFGF